MNMSKKPGKLGKRLNHKVKKIIQKERKRLQELGIGFWIFILLTLVLGVAFAINIQYMIDMLISKYGLIAIFLLSFVTDVLVQPVGPDVPLAIGILAGISNKWIILGIVLLGSYAALLFAYIIGYKIGFNGIEMIVGKKTSKKIIESPHYGLWFLFIGALTPVPYVPYLAGMWKISFKEVMIYVVFPRTLRFFIVMMLVDTLGVTILNWLMITY